MTDISDCVLLIISPLFVSLRELAEEVDEGEDLPIACSSSWSDVGKAPSVWIVLRVYYPSMLSSPSYMVSTF